MQARNARRNYLIGAVIIWLGMILATVLILDSSDDRSTMLIIQAAGAFWFIVIAPQLFNRVESPRSETTDEKEGT